jgi:transposase InsO family protein
MQRLVIDRNLCPARPALALRIAGIFTTSRRTYGRVRIHAELRAQGVRCARKRMARLMCSVGLPVTRSRRRVRTIDAPRLARCLQSAQSSFHRHDPQSEMAGSYHLSVHGRRMMESFFGTLKSELADQVYPTWAAARSAVVEYIERFYNRQRRNSALGYLSPVTYE